MDPETSPYEALVQFLYQAPIGLIQATPDGEITMINPMSAQLLMPLAPDGYLVNLFDVLATVAPHLRQIVAAHSDGGGVICDAVRLQWGKRGTSKGRTLALSLLKLGNSNLMASLSDVTATVLKEGPRLATHLDKAAHTDVLTAMPNRASALATLSRAIARAEAGDSDLFAVIFINCDRFKRINDTYGRALCDELLQRMAERLNGTVRTQDAVGWTGAPSSTAARLGADEFLVVVEGLRVADDAATIATRLLDALAKPYAIGGHEVHAPVSMGVVVSEQHDGDADSMLQNASIAMSEAKRSGGARHCFFEPVMRERVARLGGIETELRRAIVDGELFVVYQPVVAMGSGVTAGMEALVRWRHPQRGIISPLEFIPVAEESGLIRALGSHVLEVACQQFMQWRAMLGDQAPMTMSVNLSRAQFAETSLVQNIEQILTRQNMCPRQLQLEITESLAAQDESVQSGLHQLKALGIGLALDDFGTGYSSLSSLHLLPVDVVKIDRSFVSQSETSAHHRVLIEATIRVARSLGMGTVAEGIETEGQAAILRELLCDKGQGYWYSRPMPAEETTRWLVERAAAVAEHDLPGGR